MNKIISGLVFLCFIFFTFVAIGCDQVLFKESLADKIFFNRIFHKGYTVEIDESSCAIKINCTSYLQKLSTIVKKLKEVDGLEDLVIDRCINEEIPEDLFNLTSLSRLEISNSNIETISPRISQLNGLTSLKIESKNLQSIPLQIGSLQNLSRLMLVGGKITEIPIDLFKLKRLKFLNLSSNRIKSIPKEIENLDHLKYLHLSSNLISSIPSQIEGLISLERLDLGQNQILYLPLELFNLKKLKILYLGNNRLNSINYNIKNLNNLSVLDLQGNQLSSLPKEIGDLAQLTALNISDNQLISLPDEIKKLTNLKLLDFKNNPRVDDFTMTYLFLLLKIDPDQSEIDYYSSLLNKYKHIYFESLNVKTKNYVLFIYPDEIKEGVFNYIDMESLKFFQHFYNVLFVRSSTFQEIRKSIELNVPSDHKIAHVVFYGYELKDGFNLGIDTLKKDNLESKEFLKFIAEKVDHQFDQDRVFFLNSPPSDLKSLSPSLGEWIAEQIPLTKVFRFKPNKWELDCPYYDVNPKTLIFKTRLLINSLDMFFSDKSIDPIELYKDDLIRLNISLSKAKELNQTFSVNQIMSMGYDKINISKVLELMKIIPGISVDDLFLLAKARLDSSSPAIQFKIDHPDITIKELLKINNSMTFETASRLKNIYPEITYQEIYHTKKYGIARSYIEGLYELNPDASYRKLIELYSDDVDLYQIKKLKELRPKDSFDDLITLYRYGVTPSFFKKERPDWIEMPFAMIKNSIQRMDKSKRKHLFYKWQKGHRKLAKLYIDLNQLNEAIWSYQRAGGEKDLIKAKKLDQMLTEILTKGEIISKKYLSSGCTGAYKVQLSYILKEKEYLIYAVMKKKSEEIFANIDSERFASVLNDYLGIHLVPKTVIRKFEGEDYSLQYFWSGEARGDFFETRPPFINDLRLFDYLTNNADRHSGNYFSTGKKNICGRRSEVIGIDHGALWGKGHNSDYIVKKLPWLLPSLRFYLSLLRMNTKEFSDIVLNKEKIATQENLDYFFKRRRKILEYVNDKITRQPMQEIWPDYSTHMTGTPL